MLHIKLLKENNDKLNPIQQYNLEYMLHRSWESSGGRIPIMSSFSNSVENVTELIKKIPQFSKYKISRAIAGESFGRVFLLEGLNHIFKIFSQSLNPGDDMKWYKFCQKRLHMGKGRITTLPVYDTGKVEVKFLPFYYVQMAKFMSIPEYYADQTIDARSQPKDNKQLNIEFNRIRENYKMEYLSYTRRVNELEKKVADKFFHDTEEELENLKKQLADAKEDFEWFKNSDGKAIANDLMPALSKIIFEFPERDIKSLVETFHHLIQDGFEFNDVYMKNVGVLEQTSKSGKPTFIIFDN